MKVDKFISHRGANTDYVENTMEAFKLAESYGFRWIEIDVQMSSDGELFIFHDKTTGRFCYEDMDVTQTQIEKLLSLDLYRAGMSCKGKMPTMREYFDWMLTNSINTNLEIKINSDDENYQIQIAEKMIALLAEYPTLKDRVFISSFCNLVMKTLVRCKTYAKAKLYESTSWSEDFAYIDGELYKHFVENGYIAIVINAECLTQERVNYLKLKFKQVFVYFVKTDEQVIQILGYGADAVFIDKKEQIHLA